MYCLYPRLLALHDLDDQIALPSAVEGAIGGGNDEILRTQAQIHQTPISMPSRMRNGHFFMEAGGIYLIGDVFFFCLARPSLLGVHLSLNYSRDRGHFFYFILMLVTHR